MVRCADAVVTGIDVVEVARTAAREALAGLHGRPADAAVVQVSGTDAASTEAALQAADAELGSGAIIGCAVDAVLGEAGDASVAGGGARVSVWAASMPGARIRSFHLEVIRTETSLAVVGMPPRLDDDAAALLLADPWSFPADGFVGSSRAVLDDLLIVGGLVASAGQGQARMLVDGRVVARGAVGLCLGGAVSVSAGVAHGCRPVGPPMTVTAAEGDAVTALAGRPATEKASDVVGDLGDEDQALASTGLLIGRAFDEYSDDHGHGDFEVQPLLGGDPTVGALFVGSPLPVGSTARLHVLDPAAAAIDLEATVAGLAASGDVEGALVFAATPAADAVGSIDVVGTVRRGSRSTGVTAMVTVGGFGPMAGDNRVLGYSFTVVSIGQAVPDRVLA